MKSERRLRSAILLAVLLLFVSSGSFAADEGKETGATGEEMTPPPKTTESEKSLRLLLTPELIYLMSSQSALAGFDLGLEAIYAVGRKTGLGMSIRQAFSGASAMFFSADVRFTYSITGSLRIIDRTIELGDTTVWDREGLSTGGLSFQLLISQFFFSNNSISLPYFGMGGTLGYEFRSNGRNNTKIGLRIDSLSNGVDALKAVNFFYCFTFWL